MTAPGTITETPVSAASGIAAAASPLPLRRRVRRFGTGFGIAIANGDLETVIVRSRPSGSTAIASALIRNFASRPAAEWGAELLTFLRSAGEPHLAASIVLPREEVIVRAVRLPGVAEKDTASAIELQLDTLHPWDDTPIEWAWWRVTATDVVVGIVRQATLSEYETLFSEAGIPVAAATFSSAVIHAALRLQQAAPASIFCYTALAPGRLEVYGESDARPCYSAGFALSQERALAVARAELRLSPEYPAIGLSQALSASSSPIAYAAALAASAPLLGNFANLLPAERRASHSRTRYLIPIALASLLVLAIIAVFVIFPILNERRYVADLTAEQRRIAPAALRVQTIDKTLATDRSRVAALDGFRQRTQSDLDLLNELVRLLPEQVWTSSIEISSDSVVIAGEADQAAPLLKLLNSSPLFENSELVMPITHNEKADLFRIKTMRRGRIGRTTP
jgi:Tfp pilus assembly protein PilN